MGIDEIAVNGKYVEYKHCVVWWMKRVEYFHDFLSKKKMLLPCIAGTGHLTYDMYVELSCFFFHVCQVYKYILALHRVYSHDDD